VRRAEREAERAARAAARAIFDAALAAVEPEAAVLRALSVDGGALRIGGCTCELSAVERVLVLAAGKASAPMAAAAEQALGSLPLTGLAVTKAGHGVPLGRVRLLEAGHPVPDEGSLAAGREALSLARSAGPRDLVVSLVSGGASSLLEALRPPLTLPDVQALTQALLRSGAPIGELNTLRKHLSLIKGGGLALAAAGAAAHLTLVLSDVVGGGPEVVGSGPTIPDGSTWAEALAIVARRLGGQPLPGGLEALLARAARGEAPETARPGDPAFARAGWAVVGSAAVAVEAAARQAASMGYQTGAHTASLEGEAREAGCFAASLGRAALADGQAAPRCLLLGGETTVTVRGRGKGGRNQELALAAAIALDGVAGVTVASLATDGGDGPTDAAGAIVDGQTAARMRAGGIDPRAALDDNDAHAALEASGDLVRTGPTRTNVNDLVIVLVVPRGIAPPR
jgi:glycerate 2-kinase